MWKTEETSSSSIMGVLFIIIIIWAIFGGGLFGNNRASDYVRSSDCAGTSNCQVEKQTIINTATTQNLINQQAEATRMQATNLYIAEQSEKMFDLKLNAQTTAILNGQALASKDAEIYALKSQMYTDARFNAIEGQLKDLACETPKRPPYYAQGFVCQGQPIPTGNCGFNSL